MTTITKLAVVAAGILAMSSAMAAPKITKSVSPAAPQTAVRPLDRIIAVVNRDVITEFELQNRVHQAAINLRRQKIELPPMPDLRAQVLDRLITEKAVQQRAKELGVRVDEQMVSAAVEQIARNNKLTVEELRAKVAEEGISYPAFRAQIREEITLQRLREREVDSKITIPESEIDAYLADKAGFAGGDTTQYQVQHIMIPFTEGDRDSERAAESQAKDIKARAEKGEDFGKLAATYSKAEDALSGGDLGWREAQDLPNVFWEAIRDDGAAGRVHTLQTSGAWHVVKFAGKRDGVHAKLAGAPVQQTHVRHILMFVSELTPEHKVVSQLGEIRAKVLAGEDFAKYARLASVDSSATRGGDLGWITAGDPDPEFEAQMNALNVGEISEPFRTRYGYHIIQVLDRRTEQMDEKRTRLEARQALREKKLAEAVQNWMRELHDKAYVEIRREHL
jgi:peptidyl-prolyl cis-trans isomerase SurA